MARTFEEVFTDLQATPVEDAERREELTTELSEALPAGNPGPRPAAGERGGVRPADAGIPARTA